MRLQDRVNSRLKKTFFLAPDAMRVLSKTLRGIERTRRRGEGETQTDQCGESVEESGGTATER